MQENWVTDDPAGLEAFVTQAREHYAALEQALEPLAAAVKDLEGDWDTRGVSFWTRTLEAVLALRTAVQAVLPLFDSPTSSQEQPLPLLFTGANLMYTLPLWTVQQTIEECGLLLTAYIEVNDSYQEQHLRQRQRVLGALREVVKATRDAVGQGRVELEKAPQEQKRFRAPRRTRKTKHKTASPSITDAPEQSLLERYTKVEQALKPIVVAVSMMEGFGKPRRKQVRNLKAALRTLCATYAVVKAINTSETETLLAPPDKVERRCEEAISAVLTIYEASDVNQEQSLQQRQHVLKALQAVVEATRKAIDEGRAELGQAPQEQPMLHVVRLEEVR